ncbi:MAG: hypothetical protein NTZ04_01985 [Chloroflexi bacterium]|nr:hypothetical protein [Chloroflexota bacterium]
MKRHDSRFLVCALAVLMLLLLTVPLVACGNGGSDGDGNGNGNGNGDANTGGSALSGTLNDIYFMDFPSWGESGLFVDVTLRNTTNETIYIQGYFVDSHGTKYTGSFDTVGMGSTYMTPGYVMSNTVYGAPGVPKDATGLKFIIDTSKGRTTLSLPDGSSIRVE